jgi:serine/threonine protein kinase
MASFKTKPGVSEEARGSGVTRKARTLMPGADLGDYDLVAQMGATELLSIWAASLRLGRERARVMLLRLRAEVDAQSELRDLFARDARPFAAARLRGLAAVFDTSASEGRTFLAIEPIDGLPLRDLIAAAAERSETLTLTALLGIATSLADTLSRCHRAGLVHGDLGPHSVWITPAGAVCVLPTALGNLACHRAAPESAEHLAFKAPEQLAGRGTRAPIDPRADVYAFGALLREAFVGAAPLARTAHGLDAILDRALSRDAARRYCDGTELVVELGAVERRVSQRLSARRRVPPSHSAAKDACQPMAEAFRRLVGDRHRARREDLALLFGD